MSCARKILGRPRGCGAPLPLRSHSMETAHCLPSWDLGPHRLLPVVQGGMGVGISAHRLAGSVASLGAMGTISSVELRQHHPDLLAQGGPRDKEALDRANLVAIDREVRAGLDLAGGRGVIAVNVMKAVKEHASHVLQACKSGAQAIV